MPHHNFEQLKKDAGVTLIELMLYISLLVVIVGMVTSILFGVFSAYQRERQAQAVEEQGISVLQSIQYSVRNADAVNNLAPGESGSTLQLSVPNNRQDPTIFERSGVSLQVTKGNNSAPVLLTGQDVEVTDLLFHNLSASPSHSTIQIIFTLRAPDRFDTTGIPYERTFTGSAHVRNNYD